MISGTTASVLTVALAFSYIEVLRQIAIAEINGRDMKIKEIQQIMNKNLSEQLDVVYENLPKDIKENYLPEWLDSFLNL